MIRHPLNLIAGIALLCPAMLQAQDPSADPYYGSVTLDSGFLPDPYVFDMTAGGNSLAADADASCVGSIGNPPDFHVVYDSGSMPLSFFVESSVDTTLLIYSPEGRWFCNDDSIHLDGNQAGIHFPNPASGSYKIWVGVYSESNDFTASKLAITEYSEASWAGLDLSASTDLDLSQTEAPDIYYGEDSGFWTLDNECDDPRFSGEGMASHLLNRHRYADASDCQALLQAGRIILNDAAQASEITGSLSRNDPTMDGRGYMDTEYFQGLAGQKVMLDLTSTDFDTYLLVRSPGGEEFSNDDFEGISRSLLLMDLTETGQYEVIVTSFSNDEEGSYRLTIDNSSEAADDLPRQLDLVSTLNSQDKATAPGEYYGEVFELYGNAGNSLEVSMESETLDTYLILYDPQGNETSNDDYEGSVRMSYLSREIETSGTFVVVARGYGADASGDFSLKISQAQPPPPEANIIRGRKI